MERHETFTWYDYPTRRNRRIVIKRHIIGGLVVLAVLGGVIWMMM